MVFLRKVTYNEDLASGFSLPFLAFPPAHPPATHITASNLSPCRTEEIFSNTVFSWYEFEEKDNFKTKFIWWLEKKGFVWAAQKVKVRPSGTIESNRLVKVIRTLRTCCSQLSSVLTSTLTSASVFSCKSMEPTHWKNGTDQITGWYRWTNVRWQNVEMVVGKMKKCLRMKWRKFFVLKNIKRIPMRGENMENSHKILKKSSMEIWREFNGNMKEI